MTDRMPPMIPPPEDPQMPLWSQTKAATDPIEVPLPDPFKYGTLREAQDFLRSIIRDGARCPCCGQMAKVYKRKFNSAMARLIIAVYRYTRLHIDWFHPRTDLRKHRAGQNVDDRDMGKLEHWELVQVKGETDEEGNPIGLYKITSKGEGFVLGNVTIPTWLYFWDGKVLAQTKDQIAIHQALGGRFSYTELMRE